MPKTDAYRPVRDFEEAMAKFVGAPHAIAVDCCTNALFLSCKFAKVGEVTIPSRTYISVPGAIIHAGGTVKFEEVRWKGRYQLCPYAIWDSACLLAKNSYIPGSFMCVSFSANKLLNIGKGGMIFTDNGEADRWFRLARYEGREEVSLLDQNKVEMIGWNMYMTPEQAARGLVLMNYLYDYNLMTDIQYPDLSQFPIFTSQGNGCHQTSAGPSP